MGSTDGMGVRWDVRAVGWACGVMRLGGVESGETMKESSGWATVGRGSVASCDCWLPEVWVCFRPDCWLDEVWERRVPTRAFYTGK